MTGGAWKLTPDFSWEQWLSITDSAFVDFMDITTTNNEHQRSVVCKVEVMLGGRGKPWSQTSQP